MADILTPVLGSDAGRHAKTLLRQFGTIASIAAAPEQALERACEAGPGFGAMFAAVRGIIAVGMREQVRAGTIDSADPALLEYLIMRFTGLREERLVAIFLDREHGFLDEEVFSTGSIDCIAIRPRALFARAVALDCGALLLAHNHPSGQTRPSAIDVESTRRIAEHGRLLEIELQDHLIVGGHRVLSMKRAGFL